METPTKLHLTCRTFAYIMITDTFVCFAERDSLAQRRHAPDPHQHLDHLHPHRPFCRKGQSDSKVKLRLS
jgi:hypothetical protein